MKKLVSALALSVAFIGAPLSMAHAGGTITGGFDVGPGGFQGNFSPMLATSGFTWLSTYFEPLVIYDAKLQKIEGALASSYEVSADQTTYTFKLVKAKWHDGKPFTAKDAKFTLDLLRNEKSTSVFVARLKPVASVEAPDEQTLVVKLSSASASFLDTLTKIMMLPEHALSAIPVEQVAKSPWWSTTPIGTGAFKFSKYVTDQYVELEAFADFRGGKPKADKLINRFFANSTAAVSALRAGEIQFSYVESTDTGVFKDNAAFKIISGDSYVVNYIGFNQLTPLWQDVRVRKAVMHALNREAIIKSLYAGAAKEAKCVYTADQLTQGVEPYAYDPAKAKALLAEAGWDKINGDKPIAMLTYYNSPLVNNVMAAMQAMLGQVGINIVPRAVDTPTYNSAVYKGDGSNAAEFALIFAGLQNGPDASNVNIGLNEKQIPPAGANIMRIKMPELTKALDTALAETDTAKREKAYQEVCRVTNALLPWAPMWVASRYGVVSTKLKDFVWTPAPAGGPYQANPEKWSID